MQTYRSRRVETYLDTEMGGATVLARDWKLADIWRYYNYLLGIGQAKDYALKNVQFLKQVYNFGSREGMIGPDNPTAGFKFDYGFNRFRPVEYLEQAELRRLMGYQFQSDSLNRAWDLFVFQCHTGFAYADLAGFDPVAHTFRQDGQVWIRKSRQKTGEANLCPLFAPAAAILTAHGGKLPVYALGFYNRLLKEIGGILGFAVNLTSHVARKTAGMLWLNGGIRLEVVAKMLGHGSVRITERVYAKVLIGTMEKEALGWAVG